MIPFPTLSVGIVRGGPSVYACVYAHKADVYIYVYKIVFNKVLYMYIPINLLIFGRI